MTSIHDASRLLAAAVSYLPGRGPFGKESPVLTTSGIVYPDGSFEVTVTDTGEVFQVHLAAPRRYGKTEELYCANPACSVAPGLHTRTGSCPPPLDTAVRDILIAVAEEAEAAKEKEETEQPLPERRRGRRWKRQ